MSRLPAAIDRRALLLGLGCCVTGAAAAVITPRRREAIIGDARLGDIVPARVRSWRETPGGDLILPDAPQADRFYDQVLTRTFESRSGPPIMLLIAYAAAQSGLMRVHRPEVCYGSAGFDIKDDRTVSLPAGLPEPIAAKSFVAEREDRTEQVLYWTRISDAFPSTLASQRLVMLRRGLAGVSPDGVLVRLSTVLTAGESRLPMLERFGAALIASAGPLGRTLLVGSRASPRNLA